jgi:hypothetical protein
MRVPFFVVAFTIFAGSLLPAYGQYPYQSYSQRHAKNRQQQQSTPNVDLPEEKPITGDPGARLQGLLEQRFKMYVQRDQAYQKAYNAGFADQSEAASASYDALRAEVDQYDKAEKRIPVLQKMVENLKLQEEIARTKLMQRAATPGKNDSILKIQSPYWRAKMSRIDAEISLERERVRAEEDAKAAAAAAPATPAAPAATTQPTTAK